MPNPADSQHDPERSTPLALDRDRAPTPPDGRFHDGLVIAIAHGYCEVACASGSDVYLCTLRGRLRKPRPQPTAAMSAARGARPPRAARMAPPPIEREQPVRIAVGD